MKLLAAALLGMPFAWAQDNMTTSANATANMTANYTNVTTVPEPEPYALEAEGVSVNVLGQSGKIRVFRTENDTDSVVIELDSLQELDADGEAVGTSGQDRHSINTFANQDFTFHPVVADHMMGVGNLVTANKLSFESPVGNVGNISVDTFIMRSRGHVGPEGEEWSVRGGDMKFNINFPNWRWCGDAGSDCAQGRRQQVGEFLELKIKIKGAADTVTLVEGTNNTYNLGGATNLTLTDKVMLDGVQGVMPEGFPQLGMQGSSQIFTFRFPKFTTSAEYDPLLQQGWDEIQEVVEEVVDEVVEVVENVSDAVADMVDEFVDGTDLAAGGITLRILGNSGKFRMYSNSEGVNGANAVTVEMDRLQELDADGNAVGASGQERHSISTFANQDFTFGDLLENFMMGVNSTVAANKLSFQCLVGDVGSIAVDTFVMSSPGLVGPEGEEWSAGTGDMKFNIRFPNWRWCGDEGSSCRSGDRGEYLELDIKIKGAGSEASLIPGTLNTYDLGGGANLTLTDKVVLDGVQVQMPAGFPSLHMQGNTQVFRFRFPRFATSAEYDPLLRQGWAEEDNSDFNNVDTSLIDASVPASLPSTLAALLIFTGLAFSS